MDTCLTKSKSSTSSVVWTIFVDWKCVVLMEWYELNKKRSSEMFFYLKFCFSETLKKFMEISKNLALHLIEYMNSV